MAKINFGVMIDGEGNPLDTWYWTGKGFSDNEEDMMLYSTEKSIEFVKENFFNTGIGKTIVRIAEHHKEKLLIV